jgi:uncharacterized protein DUF6714
MVTWRVRRENLTRLLEILAAISGCPFDEWDQDALRFGLRGTDAGAGAWYEYGLFGAAPIHLRLAHAPHDRFAVEATADGESEAAVARAVETSDEEILELVRQAFRSVPRPEHFTNYRHCLECEEYDLLLCSRTWDTLTHRDVRWTWSPVGFLEPDGFRYWMPALLRLLLERDEQEYGIGYLLDYLDEPASERFSLLTRAERQAVMDFMRHVIWWRCDNREARREWEKLLRLWEENERALTT